MTHPRASNIAPDAIAVQTLADELADRELDGEEEALYFCDAAETVRQGWDGGKRAHAAC